MHVPAPTAVWGLCFLRGWLPSERGCAQAEPERATSFSLAPLKTFPVEGELRFVLSFKLALTLNCASDFMANAGTELSTFLRNKNHVQKSCWSANFRRKARIFKVKFCAQIVLVVRVDS